MQVNNCSRQNVLFASSNAARQTKSEQIGPAESEICCYEKKRTEG
jgi:hypothetical protein